MEVNLSYSMLQETANKLVEAFETSGKVAEDSLKRLHESYLLLISKTYINLVSKKQLTKNNIEKANIFTRWYWRKKYNKVEKALDEFENNEDLMKSVNEHFSTIKPIESEKTEKIYTDTLIAKADDMHRQINKN